MLVLLLAVLCLEHVGGFQSIQGDFRTLDPLRYPLRLTEFNETTLYWDDVVEYDPKGWPQFYPPQDPQNPDWSATLWNVLYDSTNQIHVLAFDVTNVTDQTLYNQSIWFVFFKGLSPKPFASLGPYPDIWIQDMVAGEAPGVAYVLWNNREGLSGHASVSKLTIGSVPSLGPLIPLDGTYYQPTGTSTFNLASGKIIFPAVVFPNLNIFLWEVDPASGKCTRGANLTSPTGQYSDTGLLSITTSGAAAAVLYHEGMVAAIMDLTDGTTKNSQSFCTNSGIIGYGPFVAEDRASGLGAWYGWCGNDVLPVFIVFDPYKTPGNLFKPKTGVKNTGLFMVSVF